MAIIIGIVCAQEPVELGFLSDKYLDEKIIWFNQIESCFAYLLYDSLDKIFIDKEVVLTNNSNAKYENLIKQMYPHIHVENFLFDYSPKPCKALKKYFPLLDDLFLEVHQQTVFQPIVQLSSNQPQIIGFECLSRFVYNKEIFSPDFVFSYAQENLKLQTYDELSLHRAILRAPNCQNYLTFVNVRPITLNNKNFETNLVSILKQCEKSPQQIVIELTEQNCIFAENLMREKCLSLKSLGFKLAIDDFGIGISNLSLVDIMRPDFIKISGKFSNDLATDPFKQKIIINVLELSASLGIKAVVENVENHQQKEILQNLGAQYAQGFLFYKPLVKNELDAILCLSNPLNNLQK